MFAAGWEWRAPFTRSPRLAAPSGAPTAYGARPLIVHANASLACGIYVARAAGVLNGASNAPTKFTTCRCTSTSRRAPFPPAPAHVGPCCARPVRGPLTQPRSSPPRPSTSPSFADVRPRALATIIYSAPPFRTKRFGWWANVTIAIPAACSEGCWSAFDVKARSWHPRRGSSAPCSPVLARGHDEQILLADVEGDRAHGCPRGPSCTDARRPLASSTRSSRAVPPAGRGCCGHLHGNRIVLVVLAGLSRSVGACRGAHVSARPRRAGDGESPELAPHVLPDVHAADSSCCCLSHVSSSSCSSRAACAGP